MKNTVLLFASTFLFFSINARSVVDRTNFVLDDIYQQKLPNIYDKIFDADKISTPEPSIYESSNSDIDLVSNTSEDPLSNSEIDYESPPRISKYQPALDPQVLQSKKLPPNPLDDDKIFDADKISTPEPSIYESSNSDIDLVSNTSEDPLSNSEIDYESPPQISKDQPALDPQVLQSKKLPPNPLDDDKEFIEFCAKNFSSKNDKKYESGFFWANKLANAIYYLKISRISSDCNLMNLSIPILIKLVNGPLSKDREFLFTLGIILKTLEQHLVLTLQNRDKGNKLAMEKTTKILINEYSSLTPDQLLSMLQYISLYALKKSASLGIKESDELVIALTDKSTNTFSKNLSTIDAISYLERYFYKVDKKEVARSFYKSEKLAEILSIFLCKEQQANELRSLEKAILDKKQI